jgi:hypothetical protein
VGEETGGSLYVWIEAFGAFGQAKADAEPPEGIDFDHYEDVTEFALWLEHEATFSETLRLARRWFGLRNGIVAYAGSSLSTDPAPLISGLG